MSKGRWIRRIALGTYLALGLGIASCSSNFAMCRQWARHKLTAMEEPVPLHVERIDRLSARHDAEGYLEIDLDLHDTDGTAKHYEFRDVEKRLTMPYSCVLLHRGATYFVEDVPVFFVAEDGSISAETRPLTQDDRDHALLVQINEGKAGDWFLGACGPPDPNLWQPPNANVTHHPRTIWNLPRPSTPASIRKRRVAAVFLLPVAFVVDVVTWPVQGVVGVWSMVGVKM